MSEKTSPEKNALDPSEDLAAEAVTPQAETAEAPSELESLRAEFEAAKSELESVKDQLLRKAADFDNYRKRMMKEKEDLQKFANSALLTDLVQVLDDFERAIRSAEQSKDYDSFHTGIVMIENQFASMLERKYHLRRFETVGLDFDPDRHEAVVAAPAADSGSVKVLEEYQRGYQLHEKVIRTAKVKVGPEAAQEKQNQENQGE